MRVIKNSGGGQLMIDHKQRSKISFGVVLSILGKWYKLFIVILLSGVIASIPYMIFGFLINHFFKVHFFYI